MERSRLWWVRALYLDCCALLAACHQCSDSVLPYNCQDHVYNHQRIQLRALGIPLTRYAATLTPTFYYDL